ncbi:MULTISPECIES: peptidoglycan-binding protein [Spirulina sp. CCY15215]|uniref:peptidoglycan-binding protein n=1 Tax=Spirulina sp. CCY15215 TaxID=2767591 RepID=UPI00194FB4EA|nr:peptidoglycan-binding protein [Spirulina major]
MESLSYTYSTVAFERETNSANPEGYDLFLPLLRLQGKNLFKVCLAIALLSSLWGEPAFALLKKGDRNSEVKDIQQQLQRQGYFPGPVTGYYGSITQEAVMRFQQAKGLSADGVVGVQTQSKLQDNSKGSFSTFTPTTSVGKGVIKRGEQSDRVKKLQLTLREQGYFVGPATGYYGSVTETNVRRFQRDRGLKADGIAGIKTQQALRGSANVTASNSRNNGNHLKPFISKTETYQFSEPSSEAFTEPSSEAFTEPSSEAFTEPSSEAFTESSLQSFVESSSETFSDSFTETASEPLTQQPKIQKMSLQKTIYGNIAPKSIVHSGQGLFFAQNMMYAHTITVYDRGYNLVATIPDAIELDKYGYSQYQGIYRGSPVEASFSNNGRYAWVSNYQMYGKEFKNPGDDKCSPKQEKDNSFLYRIDTDRFTIDRAIEVGSIPKYVATTPDDRFVLVSNWCSYDLSVVDSQQSREIQRIKLGAYPRGIVVDRAGEWAYVAVMGSFDIAKINLQDFSVGWLKNVGNAPRNLNIDPNGEYLYVSLNGEQKVAKIDLQTGEVVAKVSTGKAPRSTVLSDDGEFLYVVNYHSDTLSKIRTRDFQVVETVKTHDKPIGITYDPQSDRVWVSCYSGSIMIFSG